MSGMRRAARRSVVGVFALGVLGCDSYGDRVGSSDTPAAPRELQASYYAGTVNVSWELGPQWDGEAFRVYSKRTSDASYFLIAETTSCSSGLCTFSDVNIVGSEAPMWFGADAAEAYEFIAGLMSWMLAGLDDDARSAAHDALRATTAAHETPLGVTFASATWLTTARVS